MSAAVSLGRRCVIGVAVLYTTAYTGWLVLSRGVIEQTMSIVKSWPAPALAAYVLIGAFASSVTIVELLRIISHKLRVWSDTSYALTVASIAAPLLLLQLTLLISVLRRIE